ncbi:MAG: hypothetical protein ACE5LU_16025 [Anaerolineae bacterium]
MIQIRRILFVAGLVALVLSASFAVFHRPTPTTAQSAFEWLLEGVSGTDPHDHYLGTNDEQPLVLRTFGRIGLVIFPTQAPAFDPFFDFRTPWVGIGTTRPEAGLDIANGNVWIRDEPNLVQGGIEGPQEPDDLLNKDVAAALGICETVTNVVPISDISNVSPWLEEWRADCSTGSSYIVRWDEFHDFVYTFRVARPQIRLESEPSFVPNIPKERPNSESHIVLSDPQEGDLEAARHDDVVIRSGGDTSKLLPGGSIHIGVKNVEKVRLASGGDSWFQPGEDNDRKVGIGTKSPSAKFHVLGDSRLEGFTTVTKNLTLEGKLKCQKCILSSDIEDDAVVPRILADDAVTSDKIDDRTIISADIDDQAVTSRTLAPDAVTSDKIVAGAITSAHIGDGQIGGNHLARESVDAEKVISSQVQLRVKGKCDAGTAFLSVGEDGEVNCIHLGATDEVGTSASDGPKPLRFKTNGKEAMRVTANAVGIGTDTPGAKLDVAGTTHTEKLTISGGFDLAEPFAVTGATRIGPGMVVAIDPNNPGQLRMADQAYDRTVAGVISGAGGIQPGMIMQQDGALSLTDGATHPVALTGRVYVWADATAGAIQPGDLLTTSGRPGHAMKVTDYRRAQGAILGKAMTGLEKSTGLVLVLVSLQ